MITDADSSASGFEPGAFEGIDFTFTDVEVLRTSDINVMAKAKRHGRWWLLKGLRQELRQLAQYQEMLRKEYEILMRAQHPGIVTAVGMEQVEPLGMVIVMEYVDGITLKEATLTPEVAERVVSELTAAVGYVHQLGIVHRDLKPQNIMLTRSGQNVKLIDFGLADTDSHAVLKQPSGTARYMSPEQAAIAMPDVRNDIYSLGVIMQELPLPNKYNKVWSHCLLPIDRRYQSIDELRGAISKMNRSNSNRWWMVAIGVLLAVVAVLLWRVQTLSNEINRVADAKTVAIAALHNVMEHSRLNEHIDTLTQWEYRWPDLSQRVMQVNQFCYDYADRLPADYSPDERDRIREAMLNEWQQWQLRVYALSTADVAQKRREHHRSQSATQ